jgi:hypothetical protein
MIDDRPARTAMYLSATSEKTPPEEDYLGNFSRIFP